MQEDKCNYKLKNSRNYPSTIQITGM